jgi:hypothetical protein
MLIDLEGMLNYEEGIFWIVLSGAMGCVAFTILLASAFLF